MIRTGFPLALQSMLFPVANSIVQASVNTMGTDSIAAWSICDKLSMLIWLLADSMGPAMTTYVAQNLGAEQTERVKKGAVIGTGISSVRWEPSVCSCFLAPDGSARGLLIKKMLNF